MEDTALLRLTGRDVQAELNDLTVWLSREDDFRGRVAVEQRPVQPGEMGAVSDLLVVTLGAHGVGTALASSLTVWIKHRKPKADIEITRGKGRSVKIAVRDLPDDEVVKLIRKALQD